MKNSLTTNMFKHYALLLITMLIVQPASALEFECETGSDKRFIRMEMPGLEHLCEVTVTYTDDERKVMWYANYDSMFCTEKTQELKNKYVNKWEFDCQQWPDHDGVDQLSARQRTILDAELKFLIEQGQNQDTPFLVEGLKAAASPSNTKENLLVIQFFLHEPGSETNRDVTHIIHDDGVSWNTLSKIDSLVNHIDTDKDYIINSALISSVSDNGAMEIITVLDTPDTAASDNNAATTACYGNQTLAAQNNGELVAKTPHRYVCSQGPGG